MAFRMIDPVIVHKKKRRPESSQEVLRRIESYLNGNFEKPIRILHNMWENQSDTIGYQELRQIVIDGTIGYEILRTWAEDYSKLVDAHIKSVWKDAMQAGRYGQPVLDQIDFGINFQSQRVQQWIGERGAQLVTNCVDTQIESIKTLMTEKMRQMYTPDHIARMIRPCIGLTVQQTNAVKNHYNTLVGTLQESHPKMKMDTVYRKAEEASMKYAERLHRLRAQTIVQTESAFAYNKGADEAIRQAQEQNLIGDCVKRWCTSGDARVCQMCAELDGTEIAMDDDFKIKGKAKFEGMHMLPPAHPSCGCAVEYIEADRRTFDESQTIESNHKKEETYDYAESETMEDIDYMSNSFRPEYSAQEKMTIGENIIHVKRVENSKFNMVTDVENTRRNKAVRLTEKNLIEIKSKYNGIRIPKIAVVDFEKNRLNPNAIGGYYVEGDTLFINSKYNTNRKIQKFLNEKKGEFANTSYIAPYLHELGHKYYEESVKSMAKYEKISYNKARMIIDARIYAYIHENDIGNDLQKIISGYAQSGYDVNKYTEIIAESFTVTQSNKVANDLIELLRR